MNKIKLVSLAVICAGLSSQLQASPTLISAMRTGATTYSFFISQSAPVGVTALTVRNLLQAELTNSLILPTLTACWVTGDLNVSPVNCGNGAMQFANADLYTYNGISNIPPFSVSKTAVVGTDLKKGTTLDKLILSSKGANFVVGTVGVPNSGDATVPAVLTSSTLGAAVPVASGCSSQLRVSPAGVTRQAMEIPAPKMSGYAALTLPTRL